MEYMEEVNPTTITKSVEYKFSNEGTEHLVKLSIVSVPNDTEIEHIDKEENKGFVFAINVSVEPVLSKEIFDRPNNLVYILGNGEMNNKLGYLQDNKLIELEDNVFLTGIQATVISVLAIPGDTGHFKA